jgi:organic hydroperoxide reductase OsmC/OhrA
MEDIQYRIKAWWSSGRTGIARTDSAPSAIHFTAPPQFGGLEGRWTPEDLLLTAVASCYTTTFRVLAEYSKFEYSDLEVEVDARARKLDSGYAFSEIVTRPILILNSEEDKDRANRLLEKTQELCLVARALSVPHRLEAHIQIGKDSLFSVPGAQSKAT